MSTTTPQKLGRAVAFLGGLGILSGMALGAKGSYIDHVTVTNANYFQTNIGRGLTLVEGGVALMTTVGMFGVRKLTLEQGKAELGKQESRGDNRAPDVMTYK